MFIIRHENPVCNVIGTDMKLKISLEQEVAKEYMNRWMKWVIDYTILDWTLARIADRRYYT